MTHPTITTPIPPHVPAVEDCSQSSRRWEDYPENSRRRAMFRKEAMASYYSSLANGSSHSTAENEARAIWIKLTGNPCTSRTVRRWADKIRSHGGFQTAPLVAFLDDKSCPHLNARKRRGTIRRAAKAETKTKRSAHYESVGRSMVTLFEFLRDTGVWDAFRTIFADRDGPMQRKDTKRARKARFRAKGGRP